ncbi:MAG TPA: hypothetical protein VE641_18790 [Chthoniobacterales bacterium]|nr:hypothetical protein [Chthoniobacterales bacterium]
MPVFLATLFVAGFCVVGEPLYGGNDDVGVAMVGAGFGEAVHPEAHLIWSHYGYGLILGALSRLVGPYAHGWATIASIWFSLVLVIRAILSVQKVMVRWAVLLGCLGAVYLVTLLSSQYTITAGVLFGAAIANWLAGALENRDNFVSLSATVLALVLSYLIRPKSYLMGLVIILPAFLYYLVFRRKNLVPHTRILAFFLILISILGAITDKIAYASCPDWKFVPEYNEVRTAFNDFHRVPWREEAREYKQIGWTFNDWCMFGELYSRNPIYSFENISFLLKTVGVSQTTTAISQLTDWFHYPLTDWSLLLTLVAQGGVFALLGRQERALGVLFFLGEIVAVALAGLTGRPADEGAHVWFTASAITFMCLCGSLAMAPLAKGSLRLKIGTILIAIVGIVAASINWFDHSLDVQNARSYRAWIEQNRDLLNGKVTVWGVGIAWEWLVTPTRIYPPFPDIKLAAIDDLNSTPVEAAMLRELGIDDLAKELCTDPTIHLICPKDFISTLTRFGEQHYGIKPVFRELAAREGSAIYGLERQN